MLFNDRFILNAVICVLAFGKHDAIAHPRNNDNGTQTPHQGTGGVDDVWQEFRSANSHLYEPPEDSSTWVNSVKSHYFVPEPYCIPVDDAGFCTLSTLRDDTQTQVRIWIYNHVCSVIGSLPSIELPLNHTDIFCQLNLTVLITTWNSSSWAPNFEYAGRRFGWGLTETYGYNGGVLQESPYVRVATSQVFNCTRPAPGTPLD